MALAIKIGDTYNTGLLVNAPVVDIDITSLIGTSVTISNEHETEVEVEEGDTRTFKLHRIQITNEVAEDLFTDFDSIPTFTTYPDYNPNDFICKEWDYVIYFPPPTYSVPSCATVIYGGGGKDSNSETAFPTSATTPLAPPDEYDNETDYANSFPADFDTENWRWKYCKANFKKIPRTEPGPIPTPGDLGRWYCYFNSFEYDVRDPRESPYDYEHPFGENIYRLTPEWQMYRMIYPSEYTRFGISHFWKFADAGLGKYEINNTARIFANPTGAAVNS